MSRATLGLIALVLLSATYVNGCAHTYTHDRGLVPPHGRRLLEETDGAKAACTYTHSLAGRDWPERDGECGWTCAGNSQSPINVPLEADGLLADELKAKLEFGVASNVSVLNLGHAVQVEFPAPEGNTASVAVVGDSIYNMYNVSDPDSDTVQRINVEPLQFHFHSTSEHLVSGKGAMLEFHLVTKLVPTAGATLPKECPEGTDKICLAVFGVMYDLRAGDNVLGGDSTIQKIIDNIPTCEEAGKECKKEVSDWELDLTSFFPGSDYHTYTGSLTTPPCSEGVMWHVFPTVRATLSEQQVIDLQTALATSNLDGSIVQDRLNNRVLLPRNDRNVFAAY